MKGQLRVFGTDEDDYIEKIIIPAARASIETEIKRALVTQTWRLKLDSFPGIDPAYHDCDFSAIILPKPPCQSIVSFTYVDTAGVTRTLTQTGPDGVVPLVGGVDPFYGYQFDPGIGDPAGQTHSAMGTPMASDAASSYGVQVEFVAGYGDQQEGGDPQAPKTWAPRAIPPELKQAILLQAAHLYANREAVSDGQTAELARGVSSLIGPYINHTA
jgi:hypothetical protein